MVLAHSPPIPRKGNTVNTHRRPTQRRRKLVAAASVILTLVASAVAGEVASRLLDQLWGLVQ
jgi:hypothetical protein